ncbi:hypothetical protein PVAG01_04286 [Phlyctema vagabunda]|uniref:Uncharacterized protein n=1 Tax=Phlyctema vagabunda TaxID=108571 RepID=A0ABR4PNR9_9HELO
MGQLSFSTIVLDLVSFVRGLCLPEDRSTMSSNNQEASGSASGQDACASGRGRPTQDATSIQGASGQSAAVQHQQPAQPSTIHGASQTQGQQSVDDEFEEFMTINDYILYVEETLYELAADQLLCEPDSDMYLECSDHINALSERLVQLKASRNSFRFYSVDRENAGQGGSNSN